MKSNEGVLLCGIIVHWHDELRAARAAESWPEDPRFELLLVDNGSDSELEVEPARVIRPAGNLGFAGAVNLGLTQTRAPWILILNSDVRATAGALESLLEGCERVADCAGLAPRLVSPDGSSQHRWQLRRIPSPRQLLAQSLLLPGTPGPVREPAAGAPIEQPAAAALALRRQILVELGGLDDSFYPAWFGDVDLAYRLRAAGQVIRYWPSARFEHELGSSVPTLGYGRFLWSYHSNLGRYLRKHHGAAWSLAARFLLIPAALVRAGLLPVRRPRRATSRREAATGLLVLIEGALSGWRRPTGYPLPDGPPLPRPGGAR